MTVSTNFDIRLSATEEVATDLGTSKATHALDLVQFFGDGVVASTFDVVYSDSNTATAAPATYDVLGSLVGPLAGLALDFTTLNGIVIKNLSTTATENLIIGGGANPVIPAQQPLGPGGIFVWFDPIDGISPGAGTADILLIDPTAATVAFEILLLGRSA